MRRQSRRALSRHLPERAGPNVLYSERVKVMPQLKVEQGIQAARTIFGECFFDAEKCPDKPLALLCYNLCHPRRGPRRQYCEGETSVVKAKIQTLEDLYRLIWSAIANRQPFSAIYEDRPRLFCPHRLGRNRLGQARVLLLSVWQRS